MTLRVWPPRSQLRLHHCKERRRRLNCRRAYLRHADGYRFFTERDRSRDIEKQSSNGEMKCENCSWPPRPCSSSVLPPAWPATTLPPPSPAIPGARERFPMAIIRNAISRRFASARPPSVARVAIASATQAWLMTACEVSRRTTATLAIGTIAGKRWEKDSSRPRSATSLPRGPEDTERQIFSAALLVISPAGPVTVC
jgi:hypothetical protein